MAHGAGQIHLHEVLEAGVVGGESARAEDDPGHPYHDDRGWMTLM